MTANKSMAKRRRRIAAQIKKLRAWIDELRSGLYLQTTGALCRGGSKPPYSYCCLGVAAEALGAPSKWKFEYDWKFEDDRGRLSVAFRESLGITMSDETKLITLNDANKYSFAQIADWLESNVLTRLQQQLAGCKQ